MIRWMLGGMAGGAVGIIIWVLVGYSSNYEVGWIAWGVGFLVGVGVRYAAYLVDQEESEAQGFLAGAIAIGSIVAAKYILYLMVVNSSAAAELRETAQSIHFDEESMIASVADEIVQNRMRQNIPVPWPPGMTLESASRQADYPPRIWREAAARWNQMSPIEQEEKRSRLRLMAEALISISTPSFKEYFSPWDLLWFGLATVTAYKIGVGTYGED